MGPQSPQKSWFDFVSVEKRLSAQDLNAGKSFPIWLRRSSSYTSSESLYWLQLPSSVRLRLFYSHMQVFGACNTCEGSFALLAYRRPVWWWMRPSSVLIVQAGMSKARPRLQSWSMGWVWKIFCRAQRHMLYASVSNTREAMLWW